MTLAVPEKNVVEYAVALNTLGVTFRQIRDETGDLPVTVINEIQRLRADSEIGKAALAVDAGIAPALVQSSMADRGGPTTNAETNQAHGDLMQALNAWEAVALQLARSPTKSELISIVSRNYNGVTLRTIEIASSIPAANADPVRSGQEVADVITALEALGA